MNHTQGEWFHFKMNSYQSIRTEKELITEYNGTVENAKLIVAAPKLLEALIKANDELKSIVSILDGRITPEFAKTDLGMRLVSFFKSNAFTCEEKIEPIIKKATE